jgi:hypothetical protein
MNPSAPCELLVVTCCDNNQAMPTFSTKVLLISMALFSAGFGALLMLSRLPREMTDYTRTVGPLLFFSVGPSLGAAIGVLFGAPYKGAFVGFLIQVFVTILTLPTVH